MTIPCSKFMFNVIPMLLSWIEDVVWDAHDIVVIWNDHVIEAMQVYTCCVHSRSCDSLLRIILIMKALLMILWIVDSNLVIKSCHVCQFPPIESWGYLYPKNIAVYLEPCHVSRYPNSSYDSIDFNQSYDSGKSHDLSWLSDISNIPSVIGIQ